MYSQFQNGEILEITAKKVADRIKDVHESIDSIAQYNQLKVLKAFQKNQVGDHHFNPSTGYGYDDSGRDTLEKVYADVFQAEAAIVRPQIISGTHAITLSLFGVLRPGDELLYITGKPYDTLEEIVGIRGSGEGSLKEYNISYKHVDLTAQGEIDYEAVTGSITEKTKMIGIQRSKGYADRPSFTVNDIKEMIDYVKRIKKDVIVFVDNCYGEFVEQTEPIEAGADIIAGSLIKNPGGGLAKTGGYIAGTESLINRISYRLTSPGIGREAGASLYSLQEMYQGFFLAPHVTAQALKGAVFTAAFLEELGMETRPAWHERRTDLIQSVIFGDKERMITFCQAIQKSSPINSFAVPYPDYMPGYEDDVIMAAGTFIQGASIELTADGPIRPPYIAFVQGGLTLEHVKIAVISAVDELLTHGLIKK
ncbi:MULTISPECIES: aminotransferase class I/II-fold pyridoxal phosphate-dependent enzyme [Fictibacillus]|jgi:cystathionine beta-lyase family protein involved in aluminum resistance|uniref:methionine gamma-lyase family protein n=1 Tax=Fictibacillus TaxID=1329200 RepID=UPI0010299D2D|nr:MULTISPECIES: methionine gamma-lyase family protein [Fictibacillus]RZT22848.1 cystathionine beta-lyase family protein involved in aluminum resistance [Fictibacillus sp. BK138]